MQSYISTKTKICPCCKENKPLSDYWIRKSRDKQQPASRCKKCSVEINRKWRQQNPDYEKERYKKTKSQTRERHLKRKYDIDLKDYSDMLDNQGGCCAICFKPEKDEKNGVLHVDHCHSTGAVRGLLCNNCNQVLGRAKDNPDILCNAAAYLVPQIPEIIGRSIMELQ